MRSRPFTALVGTICLLCAAPALAAEPQSYQLRPHAEAGQGWTTSQTQDIRIQINVTAAGQPAKELSRNIHSQQRQQVTVLSAKDGLPTGVRISYDADGGTIVEAAGEPAQKQPLALAGATVTIQKGPDGQVTHDFKGQADAATLATLTHELDADTGFYPPQPVAVGARWQIANDVLKRVFQLGAQEQGSMTCELVEVRPVDGRPAAVIAITGQITKLEEGFIQESMQLKGTGLLDIATGHMVKSDIAGTINVSGEQQVAGGNGQMVPVKVGGGGSLSFKTDSPLANAGPAQAAAIVPALPGATIAAPAVAQPTVAAPQANAAGPDPYIGTFKGEGLTIQVKAEAQRGQYAGSIQMGDKRFAFKAHGAAAGLEGAFDSAGQSFPFTASLAEQNLSFNTEGTLYALKKQAEPSLNPLRKATAANPLN